MHGCEHFRLEWKTCSISPCCIDFSLSSPPASLPPSLLFVLPCSQTKSSDLRCKVLESGKISHQADIVPPCLLTWYNMKHTEPFDKFPCQKNWTWSIFDRIYRKHREERKEEVTLFQKYWKKLNRVNVKISHVHRLLNWRYSPNWSTDPSKSLS
jgi:hypothetical protein